MKGLSIFLLSPVDGPGSGDGLRLLDPMLRAVLNVSVSFFLTMARDETRGYAFMSNMISTTLEISFRNSLELVPIVPEFQR